MDDKRRTGEPAMPRNAAAWSLHVVKHSSCFVGKLRCIQFAAEHPMRCLRDYGDSALGLRWQCIQFTVGHHATLLPAFRIKCTVTV